MKTSHLCASCQNGYETETGSFRCSLSRSSAIYGKITICRDYRKEGEMTPEVKALPAVVKATPKKDEPYVTTNYHDAKMYGKKVICGITRLPK